MISRGHTRHRGWRPLAGCLWAIVCLNHGILASELSSPHQPTSTAPLPTTMRPEQFLLENQLITQFRLDLAALFAPFLRYGKSGVRIARASFGDLEAADLFGNRLYEGPRTFDLIGTASLGKSLGRGVGIGVSGNYLQRRWKDVATPIVVTDLGLYYQPPIPGLLLTAVDETVNGAHQLSSSRAILPRTFRLGMGWRQTERFRWTFDWHQPYRAQPFVSTGAELKPFSWFVLRGGVGRAGAYQLGFGVEFGQPLSSPGTRQAPTSSEEAQKAQARLFSQGLFSLD